MQFTHHTIRVQGESVFTPIRQLRHPSSGSTITLIGTMHIGSSDYYEQLNTILGDLEAQAVHVHYELTRPIPEEEFAQLNPEDQKQLKQLRRFMAAVKQLFVRVAELLELVGQLDAMFPIPLSWENHDLTDLQLLRELRTTWRLPLQTQLISALTEQLTRELIKKALLHDRSNSPLRNRIRERLPFGRAIVRTRNQIAIEAVRRQATLSPGTDFALLWGANHQAGFITRLEADGYAAIQEDWVEVANLSHIGQA